MHPSHEWNAQTQPFKRWELDLIGPLPKIPHGNKWIITVIDYAMGWPEAKAILEATSEVLAQFIRTKVYCQYGVPKEIITD